MIAKTSPPDNSCAKKNGRSLDLRHSKDAGRKLLHYCLWSDVLLLATEWEGSFEIVHFLGDWSVGTLHYNTAVHGGVLQSVLVAML